MALCPPQALLEAGAVGSQILDKELQKPHIASEGGQRGGAGHGGASHGGASHCEAGSAQERDAGAQR